MAFSALIVGTVLLVSFFIRIAPAIHEGLTAANTPTATVPREALTSIHNLDPSVLPETVKDNSTPLSKKARPALERGTFRGEQGMFWAITTTDKNPTTSSAAVTVVNYQTLATAA